MELPTLVCKNRRQLVVRKRNHPQPELEGRKRKKARKLFIPRKRENFQLTKLKCKGNSRNLTQAPPLHQLGPSLLCLWQQPKLNKWSHLPLISPCPKNFIFNIYYLLAYFSPLLLLFARFLMKRMQILYTGLAASKAKSLRNVLVSICNTWNECPHVILSSILQNMSESS